MNFEIRGHHYSSTKLPLRTQLHVARRLASIMGPVLKSMSEEGQKLPDGKDEAVVLNLATSMVLHLAEAVGKLSDEDADYIINACLPVVQREDDFKVWVKICSDDGRYTMMFQDIDVSELMQIVANVIRDNLSGFFPAPPAA